MMSYVSSNCYLPSVKITLDAASEPHYTLSMTPGQAPTVTMPGTGTTGTTVLTFNYDKDAQDKRGAFGGDIMQMDLHPQLDVTVTFSGNTIVIVQHLVIYLRVQHLQTSAGGNVVDVTVTDTYSIGVNDYGQLTTTLATDRQDHSQKPTVDAFQDFFTDVNEVISQVEDWLGKVTSTNLRDIPVSVVQNFVFPAGKTFLFKEAAFSEYGDLTSHITYTG
jgi:hypothetical protein